MNVVTRSLTRFVRPNLPTPARTFTTLIPHRPTTLSPAFRPAATSFTPTTGTTADVVPKTAITQHPALGDIRCGPRNTMNGHTRMIQKRRHGFLVRKRSKTGRKILWRRRVKGRREIAQ